MLYNGVFLIPGIRLEKNNLGLGSLLLLAAMLLVALVGLYMSRQGKVEGAGFLNIAASALSLPLWSIFTAIPGIWIAFPMAAVAFVTSALLLPRKWNWRVLLTMLAFSFSAIWIDLYFPDSGQGFYEGAYIVLSIVLLVVYTGVAMYQYRYYNLRVKLILAFLVVSLVPLWLLTWMNLERSTNVLQQQAERELSEAALQASSVVNLFVRNQMDALRLEARLPYLEEYLQLPPDQRMDSPQEILARRIIAPFSQRDAIHITSYALLDERGVNVIDTDISLIGLSEASKDYFRTPMESKLSYVSPVHFDGVNHAPGLVFSSPVWGDDGKVIGVLRVRYDAQVLQQLLISAVRQDVRGLYVVLVDEDTYLRLAISRGSETLYKTYASIDDLDLVRLQQEQLLPPGLLDQISTSQSDVVRYLQVSSSRRIFVASAKLGEGGAALSSVMHLDDVPWLVIARRSQKDVLAPIEEQRRLSFILAALAACLVAALAVGVAQVLARPITRLTQVAEHITAGDLQARADIDLPDEIGHLARTFNTMTAQLQSTLEGMEQRVQERTAELEAANRELEAFTYSASHDLRAPLRSVDGYSRLLQEDYSDRLDEDGRLYVENIRQSVQRMSDLIEALLNLSRLSRAELTWTRVDLSRLAQSSLDELQRQEPERKVEIVIQPGLVVQGDPRLLAAMLDNLLRNAWKFTRKTPDARVEFGAQPWEGTLAYYVHDNGAGFDMKYANRLFGAFQRLHRPDEFEGTGIGLAIVQRVVYRHNGQVWARGEVGKGATFYFTLG